MKVTDEDQRSGKLQTVSNMHRYEKQRKRDKNTVRDADASLDKGACQQPPLERIYHNNIPYDSYLLTIFLMNRLSITFTAYSATGSTSTNTYRHHKYGTFISALQ